MEVSALYSYAQLELYLIAQMAWNNCQEHLPSFAAFNTSYTPQLIQQRLQEIEDAKALPSAEARTAQSQMLRLRLIELTDAATLQWQLLKRQICKRYTNPDEQEVQINSAGQTFYTKAAAYQWESVDGLLNLGALYLAQNEAELLSAGMPTSFKPNFDRIRTDFSQTHLGFLQAQENSYKATEQKIVANNRIYVNLRELIDDAKFIFARQPAISKEFILSNLADNLISNKIASLRGTVLDADTNQPIAKAQIQVANKPKLILTDAEGIFELNQLGSGKHQLVISAPNYEPAMQEIELAASQAARIEVKLAPKTK